ncbi:MAG: indole-3-glycerol phosphate synthase [Bacteroidia bacterium]|jgi:indole-3-glycerol phosphate synthase
MATPTILKKILARKAEEVAERRQSCSDDALREQLTSAPALRSFVGAMQAKLHTGQSAVIAEVKKASPSKGVIRENFDPAAIASSYERGGAACLSVLTDIDFFQGADIYLQSARSACSLPVIRKDFIVDPYQVVEARVIGADCVLLIAAALQDSQLRSLYELATSLGLDVLIEVHNEAELKRTLPLGAKLVGINNRDLHSFDTSLNSTYRLLEHIGDDRIVVTESGIHSAADVAAMRAHGVNAFLVGEAFMRADEPGEKLAELFGGGVGPLTPDV